MGEKVTSAAELLTRARGADAPPSWMRRSQSRLEQQTDEVQNRILGVILNVEAALEMTDGRGRARLQMALRAAWSASELVDRLPLAARIGTSQLS